jgi:ribonuclease VapC
MVIDSSALLAIILDEPEVEEFVSIVAKAKIVRLSAASYVEASIVLTMRGRPQRQSSLNDYIQRYEIQIEPVTVEQAKLASEAFSAYGKGLHNARLNYGDCFTYALAKAMREPLLFKGNDFTKTDLEPAVKPLQ